jgi:ferritin-like metal-binding protein YciE
LGHSEAAKLLQQTLDEEGQTDKLLTKIAETAVNAAAEQGGEEEEGDE